MKSRTESATGTRNAPVFDLVRVEEKRTAQGDQRQTYDRYGAGFGIAGYRKPNQKCDNTGNQQRQFSRPLNFLWLNITHQIIQKWLRPRWRDECAEGA